MTDFDEPQGLATPKNGNRTPTHSNAIGPTPSGADPAGIAALHSAARPKRIPAPPQLGRSVTTGASKLQVDKTSPPDTENLRVPTFPEEQLLVTAWPDPVLDQLGHDPRSIYVEKFWLSIIGPSCLLLLRRLAIELERNPDGFTLEPLEWAQELGLGMKGGKHGPFWRSIERACRFGAAQRMGPALVVRRRLPPLTARQVERLPEHLRAAHEAWLAERMNLGKRQTIAKWSDHARPPTQQNGQSEDSRNKDAA